MAFKISNKLTDKQNDIIRWALEYYVYPTKKQLVITALKQYERALRTGADAFDMSEANQTKELIKILSQKSNGSQKVW